MAAAAEDDEEVRCAAAGAGRGLFAGQDGDDAVEG